MAKIVKGAWMKLGARDSYEKNSRRTGADVVYQLRVVLKGSKPPIWRRLLVDGGTRLDVLHLILQKAMGWRNAHPHFFQVEGQKYAPLEGEGVDLEDARDESRMTLAKAAPLPKSKIRYEYDFEDNWLHSISVEKILLPKPGQILPDCVAGGGACPPEECGGLWGYYAMLDSAADPNHPDHTQMKQWLGEGFNPDAFDFEEIDHRLAAIR